MEYASFTTTTPTEPPCKHMTGWSQEITTTFFWIFEKRDRVFVCTDCMAIIEEE